MFSLCTNAAEHDDENRLIPDSAAVGNNGAEGKGDATSHSSLRKRDLGLGNGVDPNGLGSIFGNQGQGQGRLAPPKSRGPRLSKTQREQTKAAKKELLRRAIIDIKTTKVVGKISPTDDEFDQLAADTPVGQPKLLGFNRPINDVEDTSFIEDSITKCVLSDFDGGIRLRIVHSGEVSVFNPDLADEGFIFTYNVNSLEDGVWTDTVPTRRGNRVCAQGSGSGNALPIITDASFIIINADAQPLMHSQSRHVGDQDVRQLGENCPYTKQCVEPAGTPETNDCGGHDHSSAVENARKGVAAMIFQVINNQGNIFPVGCTGSLINGGADGYLFLAAYHCFDNDYSTDPSFAVSTLATTFFLYEECSECKGNNSTLYDGEKPTMNGASIIATYPEADAILLRLHGVPPAGTVSLAYSTDPITNNHGLPLFRISHPNLGRQAYSEQLVDTNRVTCSAVYDRPNFISSSVIYGATQGGSSGSPVVNAAGQIVGQLYGACGYSPSDPCNTFADQGMNPTPGVLSDSDEATIDGALEISYRTFAPWLSYPQATCKADGARGCGSSTPCCSGKGNCSGGPRYSKRKCLAWTYDSSTPTPAPGPDPAPAPGGTCSAAGSYPPDDDCERCCSKACHTNRKKFGQCK